MIRARLDRKAARHVAGLCDDAGATVNPPEDDQNGWDLVVEFPVQEVADTPDLQEPIRRCFIQVKHTVGSRPITHLKLSNAVKMAKDASPHFLVLVTYDPANTTLSGIYCRHIWTPAITDALSKARRVGSQGKKINRRSVTVKFAEDERCDDGLVEMMVAAMEAVGPAYADCKSKIVDSVGYENGYGQGRVTLQDGMTATDLSDLLLGLREEIPVAEFTIVDTRFGIAGAPQMNGPGLLAIVPQVIKQCLVTFSLGNTGESVTWTGDVFNGMVPGQSMNEWRARVVAGPVNVILGFTAANASWHHVSANGETLGELLRVVTVRSWMGRSDLNLTIWADGVAWVDGPIGFRADNDEGEHWRKVKAVVSCLDRIASPARCPPDLTIPLNLIVGELETLSTPVSFTGERLSLRVVSEDNDFPERIEDATHVIIPWMVRMGEHLFIAVFQRAVLSVEQADTMYTFDTAEGELLRGAVVGADVDAYEIGAREVEIARERAGQQGKVILTWHKLTTGEGVLTLSRYD